MAFHAEWEHMAAAAGACASSHKADQTYLAPLNSVTLLLR